MKEEFLRTGRLMGAAAVEKLAASRVAVFGVGGVGGFVVEALVRSGLGAIDIIDKDVVDITNINRQIIATLPDVGRPKVDVFEERIHSINPDCQVVKHQCFYLPETRDQFDFTQYDYVVDAIDTVTGKLQLVLQAKEADVPIISSMGAGNKLNPTMLEVADIYDTSMDRLARVMRKELRARGVESLKVVYSKEPVMTPIDESEIRRAWGLEMPDTDGKPDGTLEKGVKASPGSVSFVPSVAGLIIASEVIKDLTGVKNPGL